MKHDDLTGESLAAVWHGIAEAISIAAALSGIGIFITATAGVFWHRWAIRQHQIEIERLKKED
jgi:cytosine/uracil/thiamine/allantoin permease